VRTTSNVHSVANWLGVPVKPLAENIGAVPLADKD
jgi:hypothetical protein